METKSRFFRLSAADKKILFTKSPLSLDAAIQSVAGPARGAVVTFSGTVRDLERNLRIHAISYEAYREMAEEKMSAVATAAGRLYDVSVAIQHRLGRVPVAEASLVVACAGVHRAETFDACRFVVDTVKKEVPIWKVGFEWA